MGDKISILVVDDEPRIVEILNRFLCLRGYEVKKAYNGHEGLNILKKSKQIDLVILDEKMPGMSGEVFFEEIKKHGMDIPVVLLTGSIGVEQLARQKRKLFKHILYKPVRLSKLVELINRILASRKRHTSGRSAKK
ncbi:response regulator [Candidatus Omnitrophota bacterium]